MPSIIIAGLILCFASFMQGALGFGLGLIAVPLLLSNDFSLSQAVALTMLSIGIQVLFGTIQLRQHIPWGDVKLAATIRYLTVPIGVLILVSIENLDTEQIKQFVGIAVLFALVLRAIPKEQQHRQLPLPISIATFSISGVLQGIVAMGGPPIILWMTTRDFTAKQARAFTMILFLLNTPVQALLLLLLSDTMTVDVVLLALMLSPLIFIGSTCGVVIGNHFSKPLLNRLAMVVLLLIALNSIF